MSQKIGVIRLKKSHEFVQYSENAAWTEYVTCEPQTAELLSDGYWAFAGFVGVLTRSSFPNSSRDLGKSNRAMVQTQLNGGLADWMESELYQVTLEPGYRLKEVGRYDARPGETIGRPILFLERQ